MPETEIPRSLNLTVSHCISADHCSGGLAELNENAHVSESGLSPGGMLVCSVRTGIPLISPGGAGFRISGRYQRRMTRAVLLEPQLRK
ncbi:hypothetical protein CEXT_460281 [Caerostris extrusa]|uniref:Uncharacterized protein n=1 Tax=Caerostris extrusa TaxID=172846 RepID=A0AAV4Y4A4_CAEEX|nr:hypothetical protein CEXT_460281 [Caerostris extrusa]